MPNVQRNYILVNKDNGYGYITISHTRLIETTISGATHMTQAEAQRAFDMYVEIYTDSFGVMYHEERK